MGRKCRVKSVPMCCVIAYGPGVIICDSEVSLTVGDLIGKFDIFYNKKRTWRTMYVVDQY